jgi:hypothetical protein
MVTEKAKNALEFGSKVNLDGCMYEQYKAGLGANSANQHMGQRKLLLSEVQLLTRYYSRNVKHPILVYVGAAPGHHLLFLRELFPKVEFILYDGAGFDKELKKFPGTFELHNEFFDTEKCRGLLDGRLKGRNFMFVSDIRLGATGKVAFEKQVMRDMDLQAEWVRVLQPQYSLLKFRLPYHLKAGDTVKYFKGDLMYGIWPKVDSGETRLMVSRANINASVDWDFEKYEQTMFFHNKYVRGFCFAGDVKAEYEPFVLSKNNIYCPCYDCISELNVYMAYVTSAIKNALPASAFTLADVIQLYAKYFTRGTKTFPVSYDKNRNTKINFAKMELANIDTMLIQKRANCAPVTSGVKSVPAIVKRIPSPKLKPLDK